MQVVAMAAAMIMRASSEVALISLSRRPALLPLRLRGPSAWHLQPATRSFHLSTALPQHGCQSKTSPQERSAAVGSDLLGPRWREKVACMQLHRDGRREKWNERARDFLALLGSMRTHPAGGLRGDATDSPSPNASSAARASAALLDDPIDTSLSHGLYTVMAGLSRYGSLSLCLQLASEVEANGFRLEQRHLDTLLRAHAMRGDVEAALKVFEKIVAMHGRADHSLVLTLLAFTTAAAQPPLQPEKMVQAEAFLSQYLHKFQLSHAPIYAHIVLMAGYGKIGNAAMVLTASRRLWKVIDDEAGDIERSPSVELSRTAMQQEVLSPGAVVYSREGITRAMITALLDANAFEAAFQTYRKALSSGMSLGLKTLLPLCRAAVSRELESMSVNGVQPRSDAAQTASDVSEQSDGEITLEKLLYLATPKVYQGSLDLAVLKYRLDLCRMDSSAVSEWQDSSLDLSSRGMRHRASSFLAAWSRSTVPSIMPSFVSRNIAQLTALCEEGYVRLALIMYERKFQGSFHSDPVTARMVEALVVAAERACGGHCVFAEPGNHACITCNAHQQPCVPGDRGCDCSLMQSCVALAEDMYLQIDNLKGHQCLPLLEFYMRRGRVDDIHRHLDTLTEALVPLRQQHFINLIKANLLRSNIAGANQALQWMESHGFKPTTDLLGLIKGVESLLSTAKGSSA